MKWRRWRWMTAAVMGVGGCAPTAVPVVPRAVAPTPEPAKPVAGFVGNAGCAAAACHGGPAPERPTPVNAMSFWLRHDRHADAFTMLLGASSKAMIQRLNGEKPADQDARCLACHATAAAPVEFHREGVSCETCHGAAGTWLEPHVRRDWQKTPEHYAKYGMTWLGALDRQVDSCIGCHVGEPGREVNHELIAAGHPRLAFEFTSYRVNMPRHWRESDPDEVVAWRTGQLAVAEASLKLLAGRKADQWPEFADLDCFACHQPIRGGTDKSASRVPLRWNPWSYSGPLRELDSSAKAPIKVLSEALGKPLSADIKKAVADLKAAIAAVRTMPVDELKAKLATLPTPETYEDAVQHLLMLPCLDPKLASDDWKATAGLLQDERPPRKDSGPYEYLRNGDFRKKWRQQFEKLRPAPASK